MDALSNDTTSHLSGKESEHAIMHGFAAHLLAAREEERKHLANEIHDKLGQNLLALRIDVSRLHARTLDTYPRINGKTSGLLRDLDVALQNVRDIINHLRPPVLDLGLLASVEWKVKEFEKHSKIPCVLLTDAADAADGDYAAFDVYAMPVMRILHEALSNVAHHAEASNAEVVLSSANQRLMIKVTDDGTGIRPDDLYKSNAFGLIGMQEYARMLNGEFAIASKGPQKGTVMTVAIPSAVIDVQ